MDAREPDTTQLLAAVREGSREAFDELFARVYGELRAIARRRLRERRPGVTLDTTALVHEAYLKLAGPEDLDWRNRAHFLAVASRAMRQIIIDYARARNAQKRGGGARPIPLSAVQVAGEDRSADLLVLDEALERLRDRSKRLATTVEMRFFGGLTYDEIAAVTERSVPTVKRDWARARTWLHRWMN